MSAIHVAMKGQSKIFCILYLFPSDFRNHKIISFLLFIYFFFFHNSVFSLSLFPILFSPDSPICSLIFQRSMRDPTVTGFDELAPAKPNACRCRRRSRNHTEQCKIAPHRTHELRTSSSLSCRLVAKR